MRKLFIFSVVFTLLFGVLPAAFAGSALAWPVKGSIIKQFAQGEHRGVDISANIGDTVVSAGDGVVYGIGKTPRGEPYISIDHPGGITTTYLPVKASVSKGQSVKSGEAIGVLSEEGDESSAAPHLHLGLFLTASRGKPHYLNPEEYLALADTSSPNAAKSAALSRASNLPSLGVTASGKPPTREQPLTQETKPNRELAPPPAAASPIGNNAVLRSSLASLDKPTTNIGSIAMKPQARISKVQNNTPDTAPDMAGEHTLSLKHGAGPVAHADMLASINSSAGPAKGLVKDLNKGKVGDIAANRPIHSWAAAICDRLLPKPVLIMAVFTAALISTSLLIKRIRWVKADPLLHTSASC
ncbi:MAG: M23 family metallopeptidase [Firmicutes bacterium]|nr:M23 family metallopeptidase [Bacillota bacterium]